MFNKNLKGGHYEKFSKNQRKFIFIHSVFVK